MNQIIIIEALNEAYNLVCNEYDSVYDDELKSEYIRVINLLENAIKEINSTKENTLT